MCVGEGAGQGSCKTYSSQYSRVSDTGFHQQLWGLQSAAADNHPSCRGQVDGTGDASAYDNNACSHAACPNNTLHPSSALQFEIGPLHCRLKVGDGWPTTLSIGIVVCRVAEHLCLASRVGIDVEFLVTSISYEPLLCDIVAGLLVV